MFKINRDQFGNITGISIRKAGWLLGSLFVLPAVALIIFRLMFVNFVDSYQLGYKFDKRGGGRLERLTRLVKDPSGRLVLVPRTGYIVTLPFVVSVHTVDLRPMQVCITANSRVLNCKLVEFNPNGLELFLKWHGRADYDGGNSGSTSSSSGATSFNQILTSYAYDGSGKVYPFLNIIRELKPEEIFKP